MRSVLRDGPGPFRNEGAVAASPSPDAQDLTRYYQAAATRALGEDVALASLTCGYTLCMGEVRSRSQGGFRDWVALFGKDRGAPHYALMTAEHPLGSAPSSGRFVFSIDPTANGISAEPARLPHARRQGSACTLYDSMT